MIRGRLRQGVGTREMFETVKAGGPVMVPIILCSIVALAIVIGRLWRLGGKSGAGTRRREGWGRGGERGGVPKDPPDKVRQWVENQTLSDKQIRALEQHS